MRVLELIGGNEDIGRGPLFWLPFALVVAAFLAAPTWLTEFEAYNISFYLLNIPMALGLCLLWGYCGVLSFGQVAYFGIAGYTYGIVAGNLVGLSWGPLAGSLAGLAAAAVVAAVFGYFVFYARVQMWIVPILTLVLTLLLETFLGQTAGYQWRVGSVQLGGYNGMTGIPSFQLGSHVFFGFSFFYYVLVLVLVCYLGCRMLVNASWGKVLLAIREDALRTEILGYDIRFRQWATFVLAAVLAGISGLLYVQWGNYITPTQVGLLQAALPVIWVAVGGRDKLLAVIFGTYALNWLNYSLSSQGNQYALVIIGGLLVAVMLFFPRGIVVGIADLLSAATPATRHERRSSRSSISPSGSAAWSRPTTSASRSEAAACNASSAPTAPASRPSSRCCAASSSRMPAASCSRAARSRASCRSRACGSGSASPSRPTAPSASCRCARTSPCRWRCGAARPRSATAMRSSCSSCPRPTRPWRARSRITSGSGWRS